MVGLNPSFDRFLANFAVLVLLMLCSTSLSLVIAALTPNGTVAAIFGGIVILVIMLTSGFFVTTALIPIFLRWVTDVSFLRWGFELLEYIEFSGSTGWYCLPSQLVQGVCPLQTGDDILKHIGLSNYDYGVAVIIIVGLFLLFRSITYFALLVCCLFFLMHMSSMCALIFMHSSSFTDPKTSDSCNAAALYSQNSLHRVRSFSIENVIIIQWPIAQL